MGDVSNESEWAADRKVGFAMGILLIGVVAALFFRNEPLAIDDAPVVEREELIDSRLRDRNVAVYTDENERPADSRSQPWTIPGVLDEFEGSHNGVALPITAAPIGQQDVAADVPGSSGLAAVLRGPSRTVRSPDFTPPAVSGSASARTSTGDAAARPTDTFEIPEFTEGGSAAPSDFEEYTIRYGDTLSGIADRKLGSPTRYREIYDANRDRMASPDRLQVGTAIRIPRL